MAPTAKDNRAARVPDKMTEAAHARVEGQNSRVRAAARHGDEEEVSEDGNVQTQGGFMLRRKRKANPTRSKPQTTGTEIHDKNGHGECLRAENEMLRLRLAYKTKELEAEQIRSLKLELDLKDKEIESLKKQNEDLRAENEHCRKTAKPQRIPRLCRSCKEYVLGHDYRNCPKKRASASSSEQDEGDDSSYNSQSHAVLIPTP